MKEQAKSKEEAEEIKASDAEAKLSVSDKETDETPKAQEKINEDMPDYFAAKDTDYTNAHTFDTGKQFDAEKDIARKAEEDKETWEKERDAELTIPYHVPKLIVPDLKNKEMLQDPKIKATEQRIAHKMMVEAAHAQAAKKGYKWPQIALRVHKEKVGEMIVRHNIGLGKVDDQLDKAQGLINHLKEEKLKKDKQEEIWAKQRATDKEIKDEHIAWLKMKETAMEAAKAHQAEQTKAADKAEAEQVAEMKDSARKRKAEEKTMEEETEIETQKAEQKAQAEP